MRTLCRDRFWSSWREVRAPSILSEDHATPKTRSNNGARRKSLLLSRFSSRLEHATVTLTRSFTIHCADIRNFTRWHATTKTTETKNKQSVNKVRRTSERKKDSLGNVGPRSITLEHRRVVGNRQRQTKCSFLRVKYFSTRWKNWTWTKRSNKQREIYSWTQISVQRVVPLSKEGARTANYGELHFRQKCHRRNI